MKKIKRELFIIINLAVLIVILGCKAGSLKKQQCLALIENEVPCEVDKHLVYLAKDETYLLEEDEYEIEDENIVSLSDNTLIGLNNGTTYIRSKCQEYEIKVSDLYSIPMINPDKEYLSYGQYSKQDNEYLDTALKYLINNAGYQSRAGVVEAARFLTLRFKYKLNYFYETGRLNGNFIVDGEGRYYHSGLYLNEYKFSEIGKSYNGPATWGENLYDDNRDYTANGLDCSGFVCWAIYNGGYDVGDIGAGPSSDVLDLTDLGDLIRLSKVDINDIKTGDLVGLDGHIGIIIGKDNNNIYIAEAYWVGDLHVEVLSYDEFINKSKWDYVILMDSFYQKDGNLTDMW